MSLEIGKNYDVTVKAKKGGPRKNKETETVHRARFAGIEGDGFKKFIIKPGADRPITWKVHPEAIIKETLVK